MSTNPELRALAGPPGRLFFHLLLCPASSDAVVSQYWGLDLASLGLGVVRPEATPADARGVRASRSFCRPRE